jgi:hypothetical protein
MNAEGVFLMKLIVCSLLRSAAPLLYIFLSFIVAVVNFSANELVRINAFSRDDVIHHHVLLRHLFPPIISALTWVPLINFPSKSAPIQQ